MNGEHYQVVVVGSGFGGSLMAMIARRLGFTTALIERGTHPRFAIGESSTPLANLLLEEIVDDYDLTSLRPLCKWGSWQRELPQIGCGLKRGFTFYHHEFNRRFAPAPDRERQLLVGASPNDEIADTHWYRPDFDHFLVEQAQSLGVDYFDETMLDKAGEEAVGMSLSGTRSGQTIQFKAGFVIDATGPRGFLSRTLKLPEASFADYPATRALFSHFENVGKLPESFAVAGQTPPYPVEAAAVHHVFPGGWIWVLKFNNGITSAGVAATDSLANELDFARGESAWRRLLERLPSLDEAFRQAKATVPFIHLPRVAYRSGAAAGRRWAVLPSAAGFVDPLLSTGFPLTLLGVTRIAQLLRQHWGQSSLASELKAYERITFEELDAAALLVGALYANMDRFTVFADLSLLYFVSASFSENARRLGKPEFADGFLLCRNLDFAKQFRQICTAARKPLSDDAAEQLSCRIRDAIAPFDVAGLTDRSRHPWYPAFPADIFKNAAKFHATEAEIIQMLVRCGLNVGRKIHESPTIVPALQAVGRPRPRPI
jgi:FADH2 O2-dependent halogenase